MVDKKKKPKSHGHTGLRDIGEGTDGKLKYQVRINLSDVFAKAARNDLTDPSLKPLKDILDKHNVTLKNQFDVFVGYCKDAEASGDTDTELYRWTKYVIEKPGKEAFYADRFTVYTNTGDQIYEEALADDVAADFKSLMASGMITKINKIDSNPANNPQAPAKFRK